MIEPLHGAVARPQHVAVIEAASGPQYTVNLVKDAADPQVAGCPLERDHVEMIVRERELVDVPDETLDVEAPCRCPVAPDFLHCRAPVNSQDLETRLPLKEGDAHRVRPRADIEDPLS